ncbi:MAG: GntR family transcriptional regulator [Pseudorhodobacter sp.]|nr:GntR family transcriptional regulator [Pseudorhodobacter sp.]
MSEVDDDCRLGPFEPQRGHSSDEIVRRLIRAIFEHRLAPGTLITEGKLSDTFKVSRTLVRQAISQLCEMQVLVKEPNQTCIVAHPSCEDTRALLDARRIIEPEIVTRVVQSARKEDIVILEAHLIEEERARASGNRPTQVRLSGEFHLKIAEIAGNPFLTRIMMQLQVLTCLAVLVHAKGELGCLRNEHERIVHKIRVRDAAGAAAEMLDHLQHIENDLQLHGDGDRTLEQAFQWLAGEGL